MTASRDDFAIRTQAAGFHSAIVVVVFSLVGFAVSISILMSLPANMTEAIVAALSR